MHDLWAIVLAAGASTRLARTGVSTPKQFLPWKGLPLCCHSLRAFAAIPQIKGLVLALPPAFAPELPPDPAPGLPLIRVCGGSTRQESVRNALATLPPSCGRVLVHDAARPFVTGACIARVIAALESGSVAVVPAVPVTDTIRMTGPDHVSTTLDRQTLLAVQTPQGFDLAVLRRAHAAAPPEGSATDDASLVERLGLSVTCVQGEPSNMKITTADHLALLDPVGNVFAPRTGFGYDVHRFGPGRPLVLGGVPIPGGLTVVAHSDGDVLLHALCDALLGAAGLGDIGRHFPDTDPRFENISSGVLLSETAAMLAAREARISHLDLTVITQTPRIAPHAAAIQGNIAAILGLDSSRVNVKATTEEGLGFTGRKEGIKAVAVATLLMPQTPAA